MSFTAINETILVPFKYDWEIENRDLVQWTNGTINSPPFGPKNFDAIKFKLQLSCNYNTPKKSINLISVNSIDPALDMKYKIIMNQTSKKILEFEKDIKLSKRQNWTILAEFIGVTSIQCDFELKLANKLGHQLNSFRSNSQFCDVTFVVGKKEFPAHKNILAACSHYFAVMFSRDAFVENQQSRVDITDIDEKVFGALLDFVYTSLVMNMDEIALELLVAAHKYEISSLVELCTQSMMETICIDNAVNYLSNANTHNLAGLKSIAIDYISRNAHTIIKREEWIELVKTNNSLSAELYLDLVNKQPQT